MPSTVGHRDYSATPVSRKLGISPGLRVLLINLPPGVDLALPPDVVTHRRPGSSPYDVIVLFATDERALRSRLASATARLATAGGLWIAWPKRSGGLATDLDSNVVQKIGLGTGLVDNKVCAIDDVWSALRFVVRLRDRPRRPPG